jgi:hypothetical protein
MAYPPVIPPNNRQNSTLELDSHPSDHNLIANAFNQLPWGNVAPPAMTAGHSGIAQTWVNVTGLSITATLINGRRYLVRSYLLCSVPGTGATYGRGRNNSSVSGVLTPAVVPVSCDAANGAMTIIVDSIIVGAGVQHTITSQAMVDTFTLSVSAGSYLVVQDIGV